MKAQIAGEHLKDLLTSGKVLNIGYGKVCNSKLIALQLCWNFELYSSFKYPTESPVPWDSYTVHRLSIFSRHIRKEAFNHWEKRLRALRASSHSVQEFFDRRKIWEQCEVCRMARYQSIIRWGWVCNEESCTLRRIFFLTLLSATRQCNGTLFTTCITKNYVQWTREKTFQNLSNTLLSN